MRTLLLLTALLLAVPAYGQDTVQWNTAALATANTSKDGTTGTISFVYKNDSGSPVYVDRLIWRATGTNIQSVGRVFLNSGKPVSEAANNVLFAEKTLPATTGSETAEIAVVVIDIEAWIPPDGRIFCTTGTTVASGYRITAIAKQVTEILE
jgi:hypothetical protein